VALLPLLVALSRPRAGFAAPRPLRAFGLGLTAGIVYFSGTLYWLTDVMVTFGGLSSPIAIVLAGLLIAYLALFPALFAVAFAFIQRRFRADALLIAPAIWVTSELGRAYILTGFPWVLLGYSQTPVLPIAQLASLFGVYGLSALVCAVSAVATYAIWRDGRPRRVAIGTIAATLAILTIWGTLRLRDARLTREGEPVNVGIVQGNVAQGQKWDRAFAKQIFDSYLELSRQVAARGAKLIVWPESSTPFMFERDPIGADALRQLTRESGAFLLFGSDQFEGQPPGPLRVYNSAFLLRPDGLVAGVYKKMHLVPFGEYVPFKRLLFFVAPLVEGIGDFEAGERVDVMPVGDGQSLSAAICYEAVFPELARAAVQGGSRLLTTITNDAWYGESSAPHQHFEMARLRAVEQGRYLVRSANTGISGVVDPYGRVLLRTDLFVPAAVNAEARYLDDRTVYARIGDAFAYACVAVTLWALLASRGARV
jgi:apolipoprotein N-acyltransferase